MAPGDRLGPYELVSPIGEGGMGEVWKARDTRLDRIVALKFSKAAFSERFEREARAVAALNHPHICTLHDVGPNYLVMEFVEGAPLKGPLAVDKAIEYGAQILDALDAAHKKGITHRDLKPANVLVTKQGVKLLDFGLARHSHGPLAETDATLTKALTSEGQILGTLQYMSPEQLQARQADARSDIFAFGCVLYELLSGKRAFSGETAASVIAAIMEREPAPIDAAPPLDRVIKTCLAKDPDQRFQTALDLKRNLLWAVEQPVAEKKAPSKMPWIWAAAAAVVGAVGTWISARPAAKTDDSVYWLTINPPEGGSIDPLSMFSVSRDGKKIAFVATAKERSGIWIRSLDDPAPRFVPGTELGRFPFWSPDSRSIAFEQASTVMRVALDGGTPAVVAREGYFGGFWAENEQIYLGTSRGVLRVNAAGGPVETLTKIDTNLGDVVHGFPHVFPNGTLLFRNRTDSPGRTGLYVTSLSNLSEQTLVQATGSSYFYANGSLVWSTGTTLTIQPFDPAQKKLTGQPNQISFPIRATEFGNIAGHGSDTSLALARGAAEESAHLVWLDLSGKETNVMGKMGGRQSFRLSPDGSRVASNGTFGGKSSARIAAVTDGNWSRLTFGSAIAGFATWSPDSRYLLYQSSSGGMIGKAADGSGPEEQITKSANFQWPQDWSKDGATILFYERDPKTQRDIWTMPSTPAGKPDPSKARIYLRTPANEYLARFSPERNPRWIVYVSDESGRNEVYVQGFPEPRGKWQISNGGGMYPEWHPDGKGIYYVGPDQMLKSVRVMATETSFAAGETRNLFAVPLTTNQPYAVAPDGKRFLVREPSREESGPIEVIVNWPALLKRGNL